MSVDWGLYCFLIPLLTFLWRKNHFEVQKNLFIYLFMSGMFNSWQLLWIVWTWRFSCFYVYLCLHFYQHMLSLSLSLYIYIYIYIYNCERYWIEYIRKTEWINGFWRHGKWRDWRTVVWFRILFHVFVLHFTRKNIFNINASKFIYL